MVATRPKAATPSANHCAPPVRIFSETSNSGSSNIACAIDGAGDAADDLRDDVTQPHRATSVRAFKRKDQRYRGIEMRAGDRPENGDEHDEDRAGRQCIAEQRERDILGQAFRP